MNVLTAIDLRVQVLLSIQRALVGTVTPNLRLVVCSWSDSAIEIRAIYDGPPTPDEVEEMSIVETNVIADFPSSMSIQVRCSQSHSAFKDAVAKDEVIVYGRWEPL
jgi:hypothetical protein